MRICTYVAKLRHTASILLMHIIEIFLFCAPKNKRNFILAEKKKKTGNCGNAGFHYGLILFLLKRILYAISYVSQMGFDKFISAVLLGQ